MRLRSGLPRIEEIPKSKFNMRNIGRELKNRDNYIKVEGDHREVQMKKTRKER